jgi:hypothetical protein
LRSSYCPPASTGIGSYMETWLRLRGYLGFTELISEARSFMDGVLNCW